MCIEEDDTNVLVMLPDMPDDILIDSGLWKELFLSWWDYDGFKLPQIYIKTVPMDSGVSLTFLYVLIIPIIHNVLLYVKNIIDKSVDCGLHFIL